MELCRMCWALKTILIILMATVLSRAEIQNIEITATENSITLTFTPNPAATNYTVSFRQSQSVFYTDYALDPPYNVSSLSITHSDGVLAGIRYTVDVYENVTSPDFRVMEREVATVPLQPKAVQTVDKGTSYLLLAWQSTYNLTYDYHEISYKRQNGSFQVENTTRDTSFNLTGLEPGYVYDTYVEAITAGVRSRRSDVFTTSTDDGHVVSVIPTTPLPIRRDNSSRLPLPPIQLSATANGTDHIIVTWEPDADSYQESYQVQFSHQGSDLKQDTSCNQSPCLISPGQPYGEVIHIFVQAVSNGEVSSAARIESSTAPGEVNNLVGEEGVASLRLSWSAPSNSVQISYVLTLSNQWQNKTEFSIPASDPAITYTLDRLAGGFLYVVNVKALSKYASGESETKEFRTIPEPVSNLTGQAINTTALSISWLSPENSEVSSFKITVSRADVIRSTEVPSSVTLYTVSDLKPGQDYQVTVFVKSRYTPTIPSEGVMGTFTTKPVKPKIAAISVQESEITVTLTREEELGAFDNKQASLQENGLPAKITDSDGRVTFEGLKPGTQYTLESFTTSGAAKSDIVYRQLFTKPRPPQNLVVIAEGSDTISASWDEPDSGGYDNFTLTLTEVDGITNPKVMVTAELSAEFQDLQAGTTYNLSVVAVKSDQSSKAVWDQNTTTPLPVTRLHVSVRGVDTVTLAWDPPIGSGLTGYALTFEPLNLTLLSLLPSVNQYKFEGLEPETNYTMELSTFTQRPDGVLLYSTKTQFNFSTYPESVAALQKVFATTDSIAVNWTVPTNINIDFFNLGIKSLDPLAPTQELALNLPLTKTNTTFKTLQPGQEYMIAIRTAKRARPSQKPNYGVSVRLRAVTKPLPVEMLEVATVGTAALSVEWTTNSTSTQNMFLVTYTVNQTSKSRNVPANGNTSYQAILDQLYPGFTYTVTVVSIRSIETDTEESEEVSNRGFTDPMPVTNLSLTLTSHPRDLQLTWTQPAHGEWNSYLIKYRPILRDSNTDFQLQTLTRDQSSARLTDLFPGERYEVKLTVMSNGKQSEAVQDYIVLRPLPPNNLQVLNEVTTTTSARVTWTFDRSTTYIKKWVIDIHDNVGISRTDEVMVKEEISDYEHDFPNLKPGQTYTVDVISYVINTDSVPATLDITAKPVMNSKLEEVSSTNSSITFTYTIENGDIFDEIRFSVQELPGMAAISRTKTDQRLPVSISDLEAGTKYTIQAVTVSRGQVSSPGLLEVITVPNPVPVRFTAHAREIKLHLGPSKGGAAEYEISCISVVAGNSACGQEAVTALDSEVIFDSLTPFQNYTFVIVTKSEAVRSQIKKVSSNYQVETLQDAPGKVSNVVISEEGLRAVTLSWQPPQVANGILQSYTVIVQGHEPSAPEQHDLRTIKDIPVTTTSRRLDKLYAGFTYIFKVAAVTVSTGDTTEVGITLKTEAPAFKANLNAESSKPQPVDKGGAKVTEESISLVFTNPFSNVNGYVRYYTVVVSTDPADDGQAPTLPSWSAARQDRKIVAYQALGQCEDFFSSASTCGQGGQGRRKRAVNDLDSREFVVGAETAADCEGKQFCNGPLREGADYYIKLRAFTASGKFEETAYSEKITTAAGSSSKGGVIGGVVSGITVLMVIIFGTVGYKIWRQRRPKPATKHKGSSSQFEQSSMNKFSRPVKLADFPAHVRKMAADSDFKYAEEYEDLKEAGRDQPCLAAEFPPNRPKNRFTNILPYDHSRVKLLPTDDEEGSDYINANYMPGYSSKREYIATQGPLPATRDDFWRMVWEQSSRNIVMLTRCQEKGREKSDHYWPSDSEPVFYGDLQVVILNETHMPDWTVTEFKVSLGQQSRTVRHFHYRVWPDFGVPKDPASLIRFVRTVREKLIREGGPIITHCSAGVGRSGTFIVLDHLLQLIRERDEVDVFSIVYKLRKERVLMVQTEQQYKFIHECLVCVLEGREEDTTYANVGQVNVGFEDMEESNLDFKEDDDEGINVEIS